MFHTYPVSLSLSLFNIHARTFCNPAIKKINSRTPSICVYIHIYIYSQIPRLRLPKRVTRWKLQCEICAVSETVMSTAMVESNFLSETHARSRPARGQIGTADRRTGSQLCPAAERRADENWERICEHSGRSGPERVAPRVGCADIADPDTDVFVVRVQSPGPEPGSVSSSRTNGEEKKRSRKTSKESPRIYFFLLSREFG